MDFRVLAIGDVVGEPGLWFLERQLPRLRRQLGVDFCVVNGENAAMTGLTPQQAWRIRDAGADVITLGNHTWGRRELCPMLDDEAFLLRPANWAPQLPGQGLGIFETEAGPVAVMNLVGRCNLDFNADNPFTRAEALLKSCREIPVLVDFHGEATSEKLAMGAFLDGRVSAVWGTHTHVPTADLRILPGGTGYITDLGMTGPRDGVLGIEAAQSIALFRGELTSRFRAAEGPCWLCGALFTLNTETLRCTGVQQVVVHQDRNG